MVQSGQLCSGEAMVTDWGKGGRQEGENTLSRYRVALATSCITACARVANQPHKVRVCARAFSKHEKDVQVFRHKDVDATWTRTPPTHVHTSRRTGQMGREPATSRRETETQPQTWRNVRRPCSTRVHQPTSLIVKITSGLRRTSRPWCPRDVTERNNFRSRAWHGGLCVTSCWQVARSR